MEPGRIKAKLVDVFAEGKLTGNGLTIFWNCPDLAAKDMQALTCEMRQFESIFVSKDEETDRFRARIFTMEEELDFAGHPLIGLAAHLHEEYGTKDEHHWTVDLNKGPVRLTSRSRQGYWSASMDQGRPSFVQTLEKNATMDAAAAMNINESDLADLPPEVISTGLPYLILPVNDSIDTARIISKNLESLLAGWGAKFAYVLDVNKREGRTWDNDGRVEDIATGSAAGPAAAYLFKHGLAPGDTPFHIIQGRFTGRPSRMEVCIRTGGEEIQSIEVSGNVHKIATLTFEPDLLT
ncbi:MAG: PhzF family phenazine biosynthesis protein [Desulfobacterales bacterium]|nr:PhzF family phenazine biosynthesis protein [Desulfobacterales bacterium]